MPDPGEIIGTARDNLTELFKTQPLALGVIGLAIGAGIAAAMPNTEVEDTYLGQASETVRSKTAELAGQQVGTATTLATKVIDAASEEARKQGLTLEGARTAAGEVNGKVSRVVDAARKGVSERIS
jgi:nucleoside recognition membrane protein YjiH